MNGRKNAKFLYPIVISFLSITFLALSWFQFCQQIAFKHISTFCEIILNTNPEMEQQVFSALKEYHALSAQDISKNIFLSQYGYHTQDFCKDYPFYILIISTIVFFIAGGLFLICEIRADKQNQKRITELTEYLEQINVGAGGTIVQTQEDDFSKLQDEIYKTVTTLYQTRESAIVAKKQFAENLANIAHQLKTPITAAFLSLQLMEKVRSDVYIKQIEKQLTRLNYLEESLLTLSKIDSGTLPLHYEKVDIYTVLNLAADNLNDLFLNENISVEIPDNGCIEFWGDMEWTMEAIMNLLKNCMEHSKPGGIIHCDYTENPLYAEIRIWDTGMGFDPEDIPHLFERFYRGKRAASNGIGIGLALARSVFELQNGTITARNLQNAGACFEIRIYSH